AVRTYKDLPAAQWAQSTWSQAPAVVRAARCGNRYVLQVKSRSAEPWVLKEARLEGPNGMVLKVAGLRWRLADGWSINVVMVEAPEGQGADFPLVRLHLVGQDGRAAVLGKVVLP
ncbi:MAG TPA: hypothetical protein VND93_12635, partial [Myxococcales bacterium]|nr:hypothetical protein [Myxococcales bacterium]